MLKRLTKLADRFINLSAIIGSIGLIVEVVIILIDVVGRMFDMPLVGAQDISQMSMIILVFGAMALCDKTGGHIAVDIFETSFPRWLNNSIDIFSALIGALIFALIAWAIYESSKISQMLNLATNIIYLPKAYFQWAVSAFCIITSVGMLLRGISLAVIGKEVEEEADL
ncbi:MAG: TRAP transporter small permease [OCS116 cluster bacterium]|nr:TRAP transporter small permease [OCS116 cluster bacterium]